MDYTKLKTPIFLLIVAVFCLTIGSKAKGFFGWELPEWLRLFLIATGVIFGAFGVYLAFTFVWHVFNVRLKEFNLNRVAGAVALAGAFKGLPASVTEAVLAGEKVAMQLIPGDDEPALYIRGLTRSIPWEIARDFFEASQETQPYLWPEWTSPHEVFVVDLTNLIVSRGWAEHASGNRPAKLTRPLKWVAARFWVKLEVEQAPAQPLGANSRQEDEDEDDENLDA